MAMKSLDFESPNEERFPCLRLARECLAMGNEGPVILNAANEVAVQQFLEDQIGFMEIPALIETALMQFKGSKFKNLDEVIDLDLRVKAFTREVTKNPGYSNIRA